MFFAAAMVGSYQAPAVALTGVAAILGHILPVYLKFEGGKGVATSAGVFSLLLPRALGLSIVLFAAGLLTRYMSVGSLLAAVTLPAAATYFYGSLNPGTVVAFCVAVIVIYRHRENIERLLHGEENRFF